MENVNPYYTRATNRPKGMTRQQIADWALNERTISDPNTGCMYWQGAATKTENNIYGAIRLGGKRDYPHRLIAEVHHGLKPSQVVDHVVAKGCSGLGLCINPQHLESTTQAENVKRGYAARRAA